MAKPKTAARQAPPLDGDTFATEMLPDQRPRSRMVEVKRTLRYAKAYQYPVGHPMHGQGRVFSPGDESEIPDDFPDGPHWSDYPLDGYETVDSDGRTVSLIPEGVDPTSIDGNIAKAKDDAEMARIRREARAAMGPQGVRGMR